MGRRRQPVDLIIANGNKHLTKAEIEERRASEIKAPPPPRIKVPEWLPEGLKKSFRKYAKSLVKIGIYSDIDADVLGRYLVAQASWLKATEQVAVYLSMKDSEKVLEWGSIQDKFYKQATASARELGLTVSARCKLVIPVKETAEPGEDDDLFA